MRNKYKNKIVTESNGKDIIINEKNLRLNSSINEFKDIKEKKIFIKKQLTLNNENNIKKEKKIPFNNNNDLKLYKHVQIRKKLYPQSKDLISPKYNNIIQKVKAFDNNISSFSNFNSKYKKIILNNNKNNSLKINLDDKSNSLLNTIQIRRKKNGIINNNENKIHLNKTVNNKNNQVFNYVKKKVIYHGKNNSIINLSKNRNNNNIENKQKLKKQTNINKEQKFIEKNNRNFNYISNSMNIESISNFISNDFNLKDTDTYLVFPTKKDDKIYSSETLEINKEDLKKNNTDSNNYQITETTLTKEINLNTENNNIKQTTNELDNDNMAEKEKRRYIYINRKIRGVKNKTKNEKEKKNSFKLTNKPNKIIEIEVENNNSIKDSYIINENINNNNRLSLTEKKEGFFKHVKTFLSKINQNVTNKFQHKHYKTKSMLSSIKSYKPLKFLEQKGNEIEELGDSFGKIYLSGISSAKNLKYKTGTYNLISNLKTNKLSGNNYKVNTLSDIGDINNISNNTDNNNHSINNKYLKRDCFTNLMNKSKKHYRNTSSLNESENNTINYNNNIINNNTFNTTVNFYKINPIPPIFKGIDKKNSILSRIKNKYEHKRTSSESSSHSNTIDNLLSKSQGIIDKINIIDNNDNSLSQSIQYVNEVENKIKNNKIDLEILYTLEAKLKCILNKINNYNICYNECFDWINFYFSIKFYEKEINLFKLNHNKNNIIYYIKIELLCYFLCYDISFNKNFNQAGILLKTIFNLLHINYLIIISYIINENNNNKNIGENNFCLNKLKEIISKDLKLKLNSQDMNENNILTLISNNFKEINNYYKMIIDNLYSYYYSVNDNNNINPKINKFPNCLKLNVNYLKNIQKLNIISSFFFDAYRFSNNYNLENLKNFFEIYLFKSKENEALMPLDNQNMVNDLNSINNNTYNNNYCIKNETYNINNSNKLNQYYLPPIKSYYKYTLVLDLDETLVYFQKDNIFSSNYNLNKSGTLIFRPGLLEFLNKMKPLYELVLFSFGTKEYVDYILSIIEKKEKIFEYVLYRQHATYEKGDYVKNLSLLGRDLKKIIIVDDIPHVFKLQKNNGICIKSFYGDVISDRNTLKLLGKILEKIRFDADENDGDIRKSLKKQRNLIFTNITTNLEN